MFLGLSHGFFFSTLGLKKGTRAFPGDVKECERCKSVMKETIIIMYSVHLI